MSCVFCNDAEDPSYANCFLGSDWPYNGRIITQTDTVFVVPGYGPQVFPYALIITNRHITSLAQTTKRERNDIFECLSRLQALDRLKKQAYSYLSMQDAVVSTLASNIFTCMWLRPSTT